MTTLSLVLPVHNGGPFLADALESLTRNVRDDFEFVVVNDGSTDDTPVVLDAYRERLPMMSVVTHKKAVGLADARNAGMTASAGKYISFLDADDWLSPGYLPKLVDSIETLGCDFVRVDHVQVEGRKRHTFRAPEGRRGVVLDPRAAILPVDKRGMVDYPYAWAGIYRRDTLGDALRFDGGLHTAEDRPWIWRLHRTASSFAVVSLAGLFYRRLVNNSLTQTADDRQLHFFDAYNLVLAQVADEPDIQPKAVRQFLALLVHHLTVAEESRPVLRAKIIARGRETIATIPHQVLAEAWLHGERARRLKRLVPSDFTPPPHQFAVGSGEDEAAIA